MNLIYTLVSLTVFTSCIYDGTLTDEQISRFKKNIIENGDKYSYSRLLIHYHSNKYDFELLPYSIIMADKNNNVGASKYVFYAILKMNNKGVLNYDNLKYLSLESKCLAISHLIKAAKLGDSDCKKILKENYAKYKINENTILTNKILEGIR